MTVRAVDELSLHRMLLEQLQSWASAGLLRNFRDEAVWTDTKTGWKRFKTGAIRLEALVSFDGENPQTHGPLRLGILDFAEQLGRVAELTVIHATLDNPKDDGDQTGWGKVSIALGELEGR